MKRLALSLILCYSIATQAQNVEHVFVYTDSVIKTVSPLLTGACIEDVNHEIYGGIYSQMVFGESFQEAPMLIDPGINPKFAGLSGYLSCKAPRDQMHDASDIRSWQPIRKGTAKGTFSLDTIHPYVGHQSQEITFESGEGTIGIENRGLNRQGLYLEGQKPYDVFVHAKVEKTIQLKVSLENEDGTTVYADTTITVSKPDWGKFHLLMTPSRSAAHARLSFTLNSPGKVTLGFIFMQPGRWGRYKGLPVRKDVVEALLRQKITVLRYGGSMTNDSNYRWKNMIGPPDKRPPYKGNWYPFSSNGWGIPDFLNLCEAMKVVAIPDFNSGETAGDMAEFVEYANGDANSKWGKKRVADDHPAPYNLKYIELGNEEYNNTRLTTRFHDLAEAIWSRDNNIQIIFCLHYETVKDVTNNLRNISKTIEYCRSRGHVAWFDVHIYNDNENQPDLKDLDFAEKQILTVASEKDFRLCIFEENANNPRMKRAIAHANIINRVQRYKYDIPVMCAANCLQVDVQNDNGWNQGLLFFDPKNVWGQPSYYVSQMAADNYQPQTIATGGNTSLDITARQSADGKVVIVQVVNNKPVQVNSQIVLIGYKGQVSGINTTELKANSLEDMNTVDEPLKIVPATYIVQPQNNSCNYVFPPYSFTVLRFNPAN